jgi:AbrB family looped-hinge helix DNA binding protein
VEFLLVELRARSQITIPAEIIKKLGATEGDKFQVTEKDGGIFLCPVVVYPKPKLERIANLIRESNEQNLKSKTYDDVFKMFAEMGVSINSVKV